MIVLIIEAELRAVQFFGEPGGLDAKLTFIFCLIVCPPEQDAGGLFRHAVQGEIGLPARTVYLAEADEFVLTVGQADEAVDESAVVALKQAIVIRTRCTKQRIVEKAAGLDELGTCLGAGRTIAPVGAERAGCHEAISVVAAEARAIGD